MTINSNKTINSIRRQTLTDAANVAKGFASDKPLQPLQSAEYNQGYENGEIDTALEIARRILVLPVRKQAMSVQINTYVMFGVILPFDAFTDEERDALEAYEDDAFDEEINPKDGLTALIDGMSGKYIAIGHVVAKTKTGEYFDEPVSIENMDDADISKKIKNILTKLRVSTKDITVEWHVISHYR